MAETIFSVLLSLSLSGGLMILLVSFLCLFLRKRVSRQWQYYIWIVVIIRLLLPFSPEKNLIGSLGEWLYDSIKVQNTDSGKINISGSSLEQKAQQRQAAGASSLEKEAEKAEISENMEEETRMAEKLQNSIWKAITELGTYFAVFWLFMALLLLLRKVTIYQSFMRFIKAGSISVDDITYLEALSKEETALKIHKAVDLRINPLISSPMLIGFFHPCIVLPDGNLPEKEFHYTILHELVHYKRKDIYYKWVVQIVLCIHWFNPLLYLAVRRINHSCELSCDEAVISRLQTKKQRQEYAATLLNAMASKGVLKEQLASLTLSEDKKLLKERMETIMNENRGKNIFLKKILLTVLTAAIMVTSLFTGNYAAGANDAADTTISKTGTLKQAKAGKTRSKSDKITAAQVDKMALALTNKTWMWEWVKFFVPYMTEKGVKKLIPASRNSEWAGAVNMETGKKIKFTKKKVNNARKKKPSHALTSGELDSHALMIMQSTGNWEYTSFMLPYMTPKGIRTVVSSYNSKHGGKEKRAKDYY